MRAAVIGFVHSFKAKFIGRERQSTMAVSNQAAIAEPAFSQRAGQPAFGKLRLFARKAFGHVIKPGHG
ncbi:MAG: hypothetical protein KDJ68_13815, partial [Rhodobiaceae bacterium]|nr:hypothetical protein [Rhodobiaceae bacterium]